MFCYVCTSTWPVSGWVYCWWRDLHVHVGVAYTSSVYCLRRGTDGHLNPSVTIALTTLTSSLTQPWPLPWPSYNVSVSVAVPASSAPNSSVSAPFLRLSVFNSLPFGAVKHADDDDDELIRGLLSTTTTLSCERVSTFAFCSYVSPFVSFWLVIQVCSTFVVLAPHCRYKTLFIFTDLLVDKKILLCFV